VVQEQSSSSSSSSAAAAAAIANIMQLWLGQSALAEGQGEQQHMEFCPGLVHLTWEGDPQTAKNECLHTLITADLHECMSGLHLQVR
jgi:hypothetical protein